MQAVHSSAMPHGQAAARFASVDRDHAPASEDRRFETSTSTSARSRSSKTYTPWSAGIRLTGSQTALRQSRFHVTFCRHDARESLPLLEELWAHASRLELTCRFRWTANAVVVWDNCATQHYALNDYYGHRRHMMRVSIHED